MRSCLTIAGGAVALNRRPAPIGVGLIGLTAVAAVLATACDAPPAATRTAEIPRVRLADAQPVEFIHLGRDRLRRDHPLPEHMVHVLSPEFSLIVVTRPADWVSLSARAQLPELPPEADLERGAIVGIVAHVGEPASDQWPVSLQSVRCHQGKGLVDTSFVQGVYFSVLTAGYAEFAYVPGLRSVTRVRVNRREFVITAPPRPR